MEFDLSKPQKLLRDTVRATLAKNYPLSSVRAWIDGSVSYDESLWQVIADQGWIGIHLDEACGGLGLGLVELAVVSEAMGGGCVPSPYLATTWAATLMANAKGEVADSTLPSIASGKRKATVALIDEGSDWNLDHVQSELKSTSNALQLTGRKTLVLDAKEADMMLCVVRRGSELTVVSLSTQASGVSMVETRSLDATRKLYDVIMEDVAISPDDIIATGEAARAAIEYSTRVATLTVCAELLGAMQWIRETALDYAKTRKQFDRTIGSYQAVQHQCADMLLMTESARAATYYAAWAIDSHSPDADKAVAIAKAYCSDAGREVAHRGVQIHGGIGFTWEHDLHFFLKRIKICEFLFGDATWQREKIANLILC